MHHFASFVLFQFLPSLILCCKSQPQKPPCPEGFWEVPEGYKCIGVSGTMTDCERNHKCMNYARLCDGDQDLEYVNHDSHSNYTDGTPDENICTNEFCATLLDGRTHRCPGTTRCIPPIKHHFPDTNISTGPVCSEDLFRQFKAVRMERVNYTSMIHCSNGEVVRSEDNSSVIRGRYVFHEYRLRRQIARQCRGYDEPFCTDKSDLTPETCAWACLSHTCVIVSKYSCTESWACPGEPKCIERTQICDGQKDCDNGQDEDINLCTEDFCRNGFVAVDGNKVNYTTWGYPTDNTKMRKDYIFLNYRYPNSPHEVIDSTNIARLQNHMSPKCNHSTKCLRRNSYDEDSKKWIEC